LQAIGHECWRSTQERVDDHPHVQQLPNGGQRCLSGMSNRCRRCLVGQIGPRCRDQRACAVREHQQEVPRAASLSPFQDSEGASFEWMLPPRYRHAVRNPIEVVVVVGSMSWFRCKGLSTPFWQASGCRFVGPVRLQVAGDVGCAIWLRTNRALGSSSDRRRAGSARRVLSLR